MTKTLPLLLIGVAFFLFIFKTTAFAQVASSSATQGADSTSNANLVISSVEGFIKNLDSLSGGFVYITSDIFPDTVKHTDGTKIKGHNAYRNIFYLLSVPVSGIIIFWFGGLGMASNQMQFLKQFIVRIAQYVFLLIFLVPLLSFSINTENLLTTSILSIPQIKEASFTSFINDYYTSVNQKIASGQATGESLAVPNPNFFDFMNSMVHVVTITLFFVITLLAVVFGLLFIIMQFILRFISLLFLSLIFPIVTPFILSEKTEDIVNKYFKIWFTFLIHQPAFALGYVMVMVLVRSMLLNGGASISLLLLYTGALFFLGTVNILVAKIFADSWVALGASIEAAGIAGVGNRVIGGSAKQAWKNRDKIFEQLGKLKPSGFNEVLSKRPPISPFATSVVADEYGGGMLNQGAKAGNPFYGTNPSDTSSVPPVGMVQQPIEEASIVSSAPQSYRGLVGSFTREMKRNGFTTEIVDKKQGIVSAQGTGYSFYDKKNDLSYTYLSKKDAMATGVSESEIAETILPKRSYVDLSQFKKGENPFNATATRKAMSLGHDSNYAHVTRRSDGVTIKHHMEMNKEKFSELGINGVISKHWDNHNGRATQETTRIISLGKQQA